MNGFAEIVERFGNAGNAAETAYAVLREAIVTATLAPGSRIRADELAKLLGVSRTPVREALRKLQAEDLITENAGILTVKQLSEQQLLEIYYTREALEGMAARLAAENCGQMDLQNLRTVLDDIGSARKKGSLEDIRRFTGEFQLAVFKAARNEVMFRILKSLQDQIRAHSMTTTRVPGRDEEIYTYCRNLFRALEKQDPDEAERLARANRRRTLELRIKMLRAARAKT